MVFTLFLWRSTAGLVRDARLQREDKCIEFLSLSAGAVGRVVSAVEDQPKEPFRWELYTAAWDAWRQFRASYAVIRRYNPSLTDDLVPKGETILNDLRGYCQGKASANHGASFNQRFGELEGDLRRSLRRGRFARRAT
jgi:hypothetical protein